MMLNYTWKTPEVVHSPKTLQLYLNKYICINSLSWITVQFDTILSELMQYNYCFWWFFTISADCCWMTSTWGRLTVDQFNIYVLRYRCLSFIKLAIINWNLQFIVTSLLDIRIVSFCVVTYFDLWVVEASVLMAQLNCVKAKGCNLPHGFSLLVDHIVHI